MNSSLLPKRKKSDCGKVFPSGVQIGKAAYGLGVFAFAFIPKGTPLGRVSGKIISDPDYGSDYCISAGEGKVLEPGPPFCYLNHCCTPNCQLLQYTRSENEEELETGEATDDDLDFRDEDETYVDAEPLEDDDDCFFGDGNAAEKKETNKKRSAAKLSVKQAPGDANSGSDFEDDEDADIWVETLRDIMPGEELSIDYAWPADRAVKCHCGSPKCRGWIVDPAERKLLPK